MAENVVRLSDVRARRAMADNADAATPRPVWLDDIHTACAYARLVRAEHDAESARIHFHAKERGLSGWNAADDLRRRTDLNNLEWMRYIGLLAHIGSLPAATRGEAVDKRNTIGKAWLSPNSTLKDCGPGTIGSNFAAMRRGCLHDDHLFPPSMRLARR